MLKALEADAAVVPQAHQRRHHQRADLCFKVRFFVLKDDEALTTLDRIQDAASMGASLEAGGESWMQNVSAGGLGLCGQLHSLRGHGVKEGDFLRIEIQPLRAEGSVRCLGRVAWVEVNHDAGLFRAGVCFVAVNPQDLERIHL